MPGGSVGRDQLAMAAKVRRHWFNPCRLGSRGHLGANFSLLLYTDLIKKRKPSIYIYQFIICNWARFARQLAGSDRGGGGGLKVDLISSEV